MPAFNQVPLPTLFGVCNSERWAQTSDAPAMTSANWTSANLAIYTPIFIPRATRFAAFRFFNGAAVGNNIDVGLYAPDSEGKPGAKIASTGAVAQSGINQFQIMAVTAFWAQGLCYLAASASGTSARAITLATLSGSTKDGIIRNGIFTQATAHPLPSSATPSSSALACIVPILMVAGA